MPGKIYCESHEKQVSPCNRKPSEERVWANHRLLFCEHHAHIWDETVKYALTDFYVEYCDAA